MRKMTPVSKRTSPGSCKVSAWGSSVGVLHIGFNRESKGVFDFLEKSVECLWQEKGERAPR